MYISTTIKSLEKVQYVCSGSKKYAVSYVQCNGDILERYTKHVNLGRRRPFRFHWHTTQFQKFCSSL